MILLAMSVAREIIAIRMVYHGRVKLADHQYDALKDVDALVLVTEWKPFCYPDIAAMKNLMRQYYFLMAVINMILNNYKRLDFIIME